MAYTIRNCLAVITLLATLTVGMSYLGLQLAHLKAEFSGPSYEFLVKQGELPRREPDWTDTYVEIMQKVVGFFQESDK